MKKSLRDENCLVLQEDPTPFHFRGNGEIGVLLLHGFGGTPREMEPLGKYLHERGQTVYAPLMPGHGASVANINTYTWHAWTAATSQAFQVLQESCDTVFVAGFSMGSLLALWLAINTKDCAGLILYSPALKVADWRINLTPLLRHFVASIPKSERSDLSDPAAERFLGGFPRSPVRAAAELNHLRRYVSRHIHRISTPACVVYSVLDKSIHPDSGQLTVRTLSRFVPVESLVLYGSGHAVVVDAEWETVARQSYKFIQDKV
ncbi:MAG: alpha/beta fold hydrolase, partial [Anaerolineales bacterium]